MSKHTKTTLFRHLILMGIVCFFVFHPSLVFAADPAAALPGGIEEDIADFTAKAISIMNIGIWILFIFLNFLLDPQFIFDLNDTSGFTFMLNQIWQLSRDLMNVIFALMLVGAAVYTIVTADKEFISSHYKKFIMAVILVNFSWFAPQVVLDVANVTTATIYGVPSLLLDDSSSSRKCTYRSAKPEAFCSASTDGDDYTCPCRAVVDVDMFMDAGTYKSLDSATGRSYGWECQGEILCVQSVPWNSKMVAGHSAILNGLILNHAHLQTMVRVPSQVDSNSISELTRFILREGIILVIHIALFFPLLAMTIAFMIRIPILWLTMTFMPFYFLGWAMPDNELTGMTKEIWKHFLKAAFLPAMVAIPLSIGFILVNAGDQIAFTPLTGIKIRLLDTVDNYWQLLWWMMTLGVMWVGTFAALEKAGGLYSSVSNSIKSYGQAWGKVALKAPLSVPLPGTDGKISALSFFNQMNPRRISTALDSHSALDVFKNIREGLNKGAPEEVGKAVGNDDIKLDVIHQDLEHLRTTIAANAALAPADRDKANKEAIENFKHFEIKGDDIKGSVDEFFKGVRTSAGGAAAITKVRPGGQTFENTRNALPDHI